MSKRGRGDARGAPYGRKKGVPPSTPRATQLPHQSLEEL